jgi:hypothetical protein
MLSFSKMLIFSSYFAKKKVFIFILHDGQKKTVWTRLIMLKIRLMVRKEPYYHPPDNDINFGISSDDIINVFYIYNVFHVHIQNGPSRNGRSSKRLITKQPKLETTQAQNDPSSKRPKLETTHGTEQPTAQIDPRHRTKHGIERPKAQNAQGTERPIIIIIVSLPSFSNNFLCSMCF